MMQKTRQIHPRRVAQAERRHQQRCTRVVARLVWPCAVVLWVLRVALVLKGAWDSDPSSLQDTPCTACAHWADESDGTTYRRLCAAVCPTSMISSVGRAHGAATPAPTFVLLYVVSSSRAVIPYVSAVIALVAMCGCVCVCVCVCALSYALAAPL